MRLWIDDIRSAPTGFVRIKTANAAKAAIRCYERAFSGEDTIFEKIFGDEMMSAQELNEGLSLLWDSKDADEGFGDIFD